MLLPPLPTGLAQPAFVLDSAFRPTITAPGGQISSVIPQPDGKFIVFGEFHAIKGVARNNVARLNSDGSLDESFDLDPLIEYVDRTLLLPDGKLMVVGEASRKPERHSVRRVGAS